MELNLRRIAIGHLPKLAKRDSQETVEVRVLTRQQLRAAVIRDLGWLFNAIRPEPEAGPEDPMQAEETRQVRMLAWAEVLRGFSADSFSDSSFDIDMASPSGSSGKTSNYERLRSRIPIVRAQHAW